MERRLPTLMMLLLLQASSLLVPAWPGILGIMEKRMETTIILGVI